MWKLVIAVVCLTCLGFSLLAIYYYRSLDPFSKSIADGYLSDFFYQIGFSSSTDAPVAVIRTHGADSSTLKSYANPYVKKINGTYAYIGREKNNRETRRNWRVCSWSNHKSLFKSYYSASPPDKIYLTCRFGKYPGGSPLVGARADLFLQLNTGSRSRNEYKLVNLTIRTTERDAKYRSPGSSFTSKNGEEELEDLEVKFRELIIPQSSAHDLKISMVMKLFKRLNRGDPPSQENYKFEFDGNIPPGMGNLQPK